MLWLLLVSHIYAQTSPRHFERLYKENKLICDMRTDTINGKSQYIRDVLKRNSPFEIEGHGQSYDTLLADAAYYCSMAESYATSANIPMTTKEIQIPAEMMIHIPSKNAEMKTELGTSYVNNAVTKPLPEEKIPALKDAPPVKTNTNIHCIPGGFVIADKSSFAYERDCRAPNNIQMKLFSQQKETIECAPKNSSGANKDKFKPLSMCHPMLYGVIPQKKEDGTLYAQGICAFPEDFDSVAFNRSHSLNKHCDRMSDYVGSQFLPKKPGDERNFDERMLEFIARTNLKNYEEWKSYSQNILHHCKSTESSKEQQSCVIAKERVQAIQDVMSRLRSASEDSASPQTIQ